MVKVICCDIDGTLVRDDKSLSEENIRWVNKTVNEAKVPFVLVSGRPENGVRPLYEKLGITGPVSCFNGGTLVDADGKIVDDHRLKSDVATILVKVQKVIGNVDLVIFDGMKWFIETTDSYAYRVKKSIYGTEPITGDLEKKLSLFNPNKGIFLSPEPTVLDKVIEELKKHIDTEKITIYRSGDFVEIMGNDYDKGSAVTALARLYGITESEVMALGDDYNDVPMLQRAGYSVAMGNAVEEAKKAAKYLTDTNQNDGVAKAIKRFVFNLQS